MARKHTHSDPLDLLLDTMTNAFGAIIMIAISVSLFVNETKKAASPTATSKAQMAQRKSERVTEEIEAAKKLAAALEEKLQQAGDVAQMIKERDALKAKVRIAEEEIKVESQTENPKPELLMTKVTQFSREVMALKEKAAKLTEQSHEWEKLMVSKQAKQTIELTPPSPVRDTNKSPYTLIFRHNRLYPLMVPGTGGVVQNETTIKWTVMGSDFEVEPIIGAGIDAEKNLAAVRDFIATLRKINGALERGAELYVASYVYKDSFPAYLRFKLLFTEANTGIGQGWQPVPNDDNLRFSAAGFKPGEQ